jgi:hypothetical protein
MRPLDLLRSWTELIFPASCGLCREDLQGAERHICHQCLGSIQHLWQQPRCHVCLRPVRHPRMVRCLGCHQAEAPWQRAYALYLSSKDAPFSLQLPDPQTSLISAWASLSALRIIRTGRPLPSHLIVDCSWLELLQPLRFRFEIPLTRGIARLLSRPYIAARSRKDLPPSNSRLLWVVDQLPDPSLPSPVWFSSLHPDQHVELLVLRHSISKP